MKTQIAKTLSFLMLVSAVGCGAPGGDTNVKSDSLPQQGVNSGTTSPTTNPPASVAPPAAVAVVTVAAPLAEFTSPSGVSPASPLDPNDVAPFGDGTLTYIWPSSLKDPNAIGTGSAPGAGVIVVAGVWGTDVLRSDTVSLSGASSLQLAGTTAAVSTDFIPVEGNNQRYMIDVTFHNDRAQSTDKTTMDAVFYAADQTTVVKTVSLSNGVHLDTVRWLRATQAISIPDTLAARWVKVSVSKTTDFNIFVDRIELHRMAPSMTLYQDSTSQTVLAGNWYFVALAGLVTVAGDDYNDCLVGRILTSPESSGVSDLRASRWLVEGRVALRGVPAGTTVKVRLVDHSGTVLDAGTEYVTAATGDQTFQVLAMVNAPQNIFMQVWHDAASSLMILGSAKPSPTTLSAIALP